MIVLESPLAYRYIGDGATLNFPHSFAITDPSELLVLMDGEPQIYLTHYSLTGIGSTNGGSVVFNYFPPDGVSITILRKQSLSQLATLLANSSYSPLVHEAIVGRLSRVDQMLAERIDRALKFAAVSTIKDIDVEDPVANGFLRFNQDASGVTSSQELVLPTVIPGASFTHLFSPIDDGAVGNDIVDDTAALQALGARVQAAGGGHIIFPAGKTYKVYSGAQALSPMFNFIGLRGVTIDFNGSQIKVYHNFVGTAAVLYLIIIDGCSNVTIQNYDTKQVIGVTVPGAVEGVRCCIVQRASHDLLFENVKLDGGVQPIWFQRDTTTEGQALISSRAVLRNIYSSNSIYGFACSDSGNDIVIENLQTENVMRSYFVYGCNNHNVEVTSKNARSNDVLLLPSITTAGTPTNALENINLRYKVMGRTLGNAASYLTVGMAQTPPNGILRNIDAEIDFDYTGEPGTGGLPPAVTFIKAGAAAQNLTFDNIHIHGGIRNVPNSAGDLFKIFDVAMNPWSGEVARGIKLGVIVTGSATPTFQANIHPIVDSLMLDNVIFPGNLVLTNNDGFKLTRRNSRFGNDLSDYVDIIFTPAWTAAGAAPAIGNGSITGRYRRQDKVAVVSIKFTPGSTTTFGTGEWSFGFPSGINNLLAFEAAGIARALDNGTAYHVGAVLSNPDGSFSPTITIVTEGGTAGWQSNAPFTWVNGDSFFATIVFMMN